MYIRNIADSNLMLITDYSLETFTNKFVNYFDVRFQTAK